VLAFGRFVAWGAGDGLGLGDIPFVLLSNVPGRLKVGIEFCCCGENEGGEGDETGWAGANGLFDPNPVG